MSRAGYVLIYRNMKDHWLWRDPKKYLRWNDLLMDAAWEDHYAIFGNSRVMLERGQLVTSIRTLMHQWGTNSRYVSDFLELLESEHMIVCETKKAYTIITIVGYDEQQRGLGNGYNDAKPPPPPPVTERKRLHQESREGSLSKEDNNINNNSSISIEEQNLKFVELIKTDDDAMKRAVRSLKRDEETVLELLEIFASDNSFTSKRHADFNDFKGHFIHWAREYLRKEQRYGNGKKQKTDSRGNLPDRYANRRGTDAKDHTEEDYNDTF